MSAPRPLSDTDLDALVGKLDLETKVRAAVRRRRLDARRRSPEIGLRAADRLRRAGRRPGRHRHRARPLGRPARPARRWPRPWDEDLLRRIGGLLAGEAVRKGVDVVLGPTINLHRSPLGGRHFECMSRGPAADRPAGHRLRARRAGAGVGACPKHYVANDAETDRFTVDNRVDERTLRELYLAPFEAVVADAEPWMVMAAYNGVNGAPMTENDLLAEPLKGEWGFDGVVVSDWARRSTTASPPPAPPSTWRCPARTRSGREPLVEAVRAGRVDRGGRSTPRSAGCCCSPPARARSTGSAAAPHAAAGRASRTPRRWPARPRRRPQRCCCATTGSCRSGAEHAAAASRCIGPGARDARAARRRLASVPPPYVVTPVAGLRRALDRPRRGRHRRRGRAVGRAARAAGRRAVPARTARSTVALRWLDEDGAVLDEQTAGTATIIRLLGDAPDGAVELEIRTGFTPDEDGDWRRRRRRPAATARSSLDGRTVLEDADDPAAFDVHRGLRRAAAARRGRPAGAPAGGSTCACATAGRPTGFIFKVGFVVGPPAAAGRRGARARRRAGPHDRRRRRRRRHVGRRGERGLRPRRR